MSKLVPRALPVTHGRTAPGPGILGKPPRLAEMRRCRGALLAGAERRSGSSTGTPPPGATAVDLPATAANALESRILALAAATGRGQFCRGGQEKELLGLISSLEASGPSAAGSAPGSLDGEWLLVYSSEVSRAPHGRN